MVAFAFFLQRWRCRKGFPDLERRAVKPTRPFLTSKVVFRPKRERSNMTIAMSIDSTLVTTGYVETEGDELYYEVCGQGPPLLMIAGGGGDAGFFSLVVPILAKEYKVITYDRRGNSRSRRTPQNFEISQQSRDAVAILRAVGETSAYVIGNSGGGVIALDMAKTQPQAIRAVVVHEAPVVNLLPDAKRWQRFIAGIYWLAYVLGPNIAMFRFSLALGIPWHTFRHVPDDFSKRNEQNQAFFIQNEMLLFANYRPDVAMIKQNGVKLFLAVGQSTLDKKLFYGRPAPILAEQLGCELILFPGNHLSYFDLPEAWAATLTALLKK